MKRFTIAIPAFKSKFFRECIESILSQTYQNFELIIIDDCSPDPISEILSKYADDRIIYSRNIQNVGAENVVDNWNKCLHEAVGQYFILMGDDDILEPDYLQEFINLIENYPNLAVYHCRSKLIDEDSVPYSITPINPAYENIYDYFLSCLRGQRQQYISDFVYDTSFLKQMGGFYKLPLAWGSDYLTAFIACSKAGIAHTNKPVFCYRTNRYSITSTGNIILKRKAIIEYIEWIKNALEVIPEENDDKLKFVLIREALSEYSRGSRIGIIRQILSQSGVIIGLGIVYKNRMELHYSSRDIVDAFITSAFKRLNTHNI